MPYVLTTTRGQHGVGSGMHLTSRRAIATQDAVLSAAVRRLPIIDREGYQEAVRQLRALPESGGTVSLPDGTVITVERQSDDFDVDAYNAAQES